MDPETRKAVVRYPEDCMLCGFCELDCPEGALTVTPEKHSRLIVSWG
jgi:NAD-dependent dihydropyrimidine dehydrogenase PreA subunit